MRIGSGLILTAAAAVTLLLLLGGFAAILLGFDLTMFGGGGLPTAELGLLVFGCGFVLAWKIVRPAWRLAKED